MVGWVYVEAVHRAGGRAILIPPAEHGIDEVLDAIDGLMLTGGADIEPTRYGAEAHAETAGVQPQRDAAELVLVAAALERDLPLLAICRGMQVLNVASGGDLVQHLPEATGSTRHREVMGVFSDHDVEIAPGSHLEAALGRRAPVRSHHHQAPAAIGAGLAPVAWAEDGTIEALEAADRSFALGVQWHPEEGDDPALFRALVAEAAARRAATRS